MKGLEIAESFFNEYKYSLIPKDDPRWDRVAVGLVGHGSECFGFDDEFSRDHDFECGFCVWLTEEDDRAFGFPLFRAYSKLPEEYMGVRREEKNVFGSDYRGVKTIREFYSFYLPNGKVPTTLTEWLSIPDFYLAEATNGKVFYDGAGEFTRIRNALCNRPQDVRLKKLASELFYAGQMGQYNFERCLRHGEKGAATLALGGFAEHILKAAYLLNDAYAPYYKWLFRGVAELKILPTLGKQAEKLLASPLEKCAEQIEEICRTVSVELAAQGLSTAGDALLERHAYQITSQIKDSALRNAPIML